MQGCCVVQAATLRGVQAVPVDVEVDIGPGIPGFSIVGMPDASVQESRERVKSALRSCGFSMPAAKIVVNLAPGTIRKTGPGFDLPIALGILVATKQLPSAVLQRRLFVGELSLEGQVRPVAGLLAYALCAKGLGLDLVCAVSDDVSIEIDGLTKRFVEGLTRFRKEDIPESAGRPSLSKPVVPDYADIAGHEMAKRALQIAAAGGHGVLMMGPPGSGKTMLASRIPSILPPLSDAERLEAAVVHSIAGEDVSALLSGVRPFRKPHHSATMAGLIGGGNPPRPGEISLAHNGVLFLDELAEFAPSVIQGIRQPLESGRAVVTRRDGTVEFPARFMLVAASNPCPCGFFGDDERACTCPQQRIQAYQGRIGGPVLDRIDIHIDVRRIPPEEVLRTGRGESSDSLREGVLRAREFASWRKAQAGGDEAASDRMETVVQACCLSPEDEGFFKESASMFHMSGRSIMRTLRLARTIADMEESVAVGRGHLCEAIEFRNREGGSL